MDQKPLRGTPSQGTENLEYLRPQMEIQKSGGWRHLCLNQHPNDTPYGLIVSAIWAVRGGASDLVPPHPQLRSYLYITTEVPNHLASFDKILFESFFNEFNLGNSLISS